MNVCTLAHTVEVNKYTFAMVRALGCARVRALTPKMASVTGTLFSAHNVYSTAIVMQNRAMHKNPRRARRLNRQSRLTRSIAAPGI